MTEKKLSEMTVLVKDSGGLGIEWAVGMGKAVKECIYFNTWQDGFCESKKFFMGRGFENVKKTLYFDDEIDKADLIMYTDIGFGDEAARLRKEGKIVFGAGDAEKFENHRFAFRALQKKIGLYPAPYKTYQAKGIDDLIDYLQKHGKQYVKVDNAFRGDCECVDGKTEIFTNHGWMKFDNLTGSETVLSIDPQNRQSVFSPISRLIKSHYSGDMYEIKTRKVDMLMSPNHKLWYYRPVNKLKMVYESISSIDERLTSPKSGISIPVHFKWKGENPNIHIIPKVESQTHKKEDREVPFKEWIVFIAWFLSEGSLTRQKGNNHYRILIAQSNFKYLLEISQLLASTGIGICRDKSSFSLFDKSLWYYLKETCYTKGICPICARECCSHTKKIPDYIKLLSPSLIKLFIDTFCKGDGWIDRGEIRLQTSSFAMANDLQELIFKMGMVGSLRINGKTGDIGGTNKKGTKIINRCDSYCVSALKCDANLRKIHIKKVPYTGNIYDVTVEPHHSIFLRRNNKAYWSGNSFPADTYESVKSHIDALRVKFGPFSDVVPFMVEDVIEAKAEVGIDGFFSGELIRPTLWGIESGRAYIGRFDQILPPALEDCIAKFGPELKKRNYRGPFSTENRMLSKDKAVMIEPTMRPAYNLSVGYPEWIKNFPALVRKVASNEPVTIEQRAKYVGGAPLYVKNEEEWVEWNFPKSIRDEGKIKFRECAKKGGKYYAIRGCNSAAFIISWGNTIERVIKDIKATAEKVNATDIDKMKVLNLENEIVPKIKALRKMGVQF